MSSIADLFFMFRGDDRQLQVDAKKAGEAAGQTLGAGLSGGISKGATSIGGALAKVGQGLTKTGTAMTANLTLPILAAGAATAKLGLDFDTTGRQIVGLTDVTGEEIDGIREKILALGPAVGKGPQELAEAFYFIASAGFKADEAMEVLETSAKAAASGLGETQTIAQVLGGVINAYGRENITAAKAADILTEAVSQGTAEASGLASVIGNVVPGAAALGVSFDQVTAAMAGMTLSGVGVEESATSLIQIFSSLQKPTSQAEDALSALGLSSAELRRQLREEGLLATLRTLEERFAGNETASAAVFGNIRALRGVTALLTLDSEQLNTVFAKVADSTGRMGEAYKETEGPQREIDRAMADMQATAIQLGTDVLPLVVDVLGQIAAGARALGKWWRELDADTRKQIVQWLAWVAIAGPVLLLVGKLASGLGALFKVVGFLAGAKGIPALVGGISKARLLMLGWIGVIAGVALALNEATDDVGYFIDELLQGKKATETLKDLMAVTNNMHMAQMLRHWGISVENFNKVVEKTGGDVEDAFQRIKDASGDVGKALHQLTAEGPSGSDFAGWGKRGPQAMADAMEAAKVRIAEKAGEIPQVVSAELEGGQWRIDQAAEAMPDPIAEAMEKAKQDMADAANALIDTLASTLTSRPQDLKDAAAKMLADILAPFPDFDHALQIEGILAAKWLIDGLTSPDSGDRARTAEYLKGLLAEYELLRPGMLATGETLNPALQAGIARTLGALTTYLETVTGDIVSQYDLADELDRMGYGSLAGYVRGLEDARVATLTHEISLIQGDLHEKLDIDLRSEGESSGVSYADGLGSQVVLDAVTRRALFIRRKLEAIMNFSGSPPYSESREIGEKVGQTYMQRLMAAIRSALPQVATMVGAVGRAMTTQGSFGLATASVPSMGAVAAQAGGVAGGSSTVNNTWQLVVNGVPLAFRTRDDFIKALDDLSAFGDGRLG